MTEAVVSPVEIVPLTGALLGPVPTEWPYFSDAEVAVFLEANGLEQRLSSGDFTVTSSTPLISGGNVTLDGDLLPAGGWGDGVTPPIYRLILRRQTPIDQTAPFDTQGGFQPKTSGDAFDKLTRMVQDLKSTVSRAVLGAAGMAALLIPGLAGAAGLYLQVNGSATGLQWGNGAGPKGDPGGTYMSIGLWTQIGDLTIPVGTDLVRTSGILRVGDYPAQFALDPVQTGGETRYRRKSFNGRMFRLAEPFAHIGHFSAVADIAYVGDAVTGTDNRAAIQEAIDYTRQNLAQAGNIPGLGYKNAGVIGVPLGLFRCDGNLDMTGTPTNEIVGIEFRGVNPQQSQIVFTGGAPAAPHLDVTNVIAPMFWDVGLNIDSSSQASCVVLLATSTDAGHGQNQTNGAKFINCTVGAKGKPSAHWVKAVVAVDADQALYFSTHFNGGLHLGTWLPSLHASPVLGATSTTITLDAWSATNQADLIGKRFAIAQSDASTSSGQFRTLVSYAGAGAFNLDVPWTIVPDGSAIADIFAVRSLYAPQTHAGGNHTYSEISNCWFPGTDAGIVIRGGSQYKFSGINYVAGLSVAKYPATVVFESMFFDQDGRIPQVFGQIYSECQAADVAGSWYPILSKRYGVSYSCAGNHECSFTGTVADAVILKTDKTVLAWAWGGNSGSGTIGAITVTAGVGFSSYSIVMTSPTNYTVTIRGGTGTPGGTGTVGVAYTDGAATFTIGGAPHTGDKFTLFAEYGNFSVVELNGNCVNNHNAVLMDNPGPVYSLTGKFQARSGPGTIGRIDYLAFDPQGNRGANEPALAGLWRDFIAMRVKASYSPLGFQIASVRLGGSYSATSGLVLNLGPTLTAYVPAAPQTVYSVPVPAETVDLAATEYGNLYERKEFKLNGVITISLTGALRAYLNGKAPGGAPASFPIGDTFAVTAGQAIDITAAIVQSDIIRMKLTALPDSSTPFVRTSSTTLASLDTTQDMTFELVFTGAGSGSALSYQATEVLSL